MKPGKFTSPTRQEEFSLLPSSLGATADLDLHFRWALGSLDPKAFFHQMAVAHVEKGIPVGSEI